MEQFLFYTPSDAVYSLAGRLSFPQLLLVLSYFLVESSLPARLGDRRQLQDLGSRHEKDWLPCIGPEGFYQMKENDWKTATPEVHQSWEEVRGFMIQHRLCGVSISSEDVREHVCGLLCRIEQISAQGLNALCTPRPNLLSPTTPLGHRASLVLVCLSLSVILPPTQDICLTWEPDGRMINKMLIYLHKSPLFPCGISSEHLISALSSLEMLFSREDDLTNHTVPDSLGPERSRKPESEGRRRVSRTERYRYFDIDECGSISWCGVFRQNNYTELEVEISYAGQSVSPNSGNVTPELEIGKSWRYSKFAE